MWSDIQKKLLKNIRYQISRGRLFVAGRKKVYYNQTAVLQDVFKKERGLIKWKKSDWISYLHFSGR